MDVNSLREIGLLDYCFFMDINSLRENHLLQVPQKLIHFQHLTKSVIGRNEAIPYQMQN